MAEIVIDDAHIDIDGANWHLKCESPEKGLAGSQHFRLYMIQPDGTEILVPRLQGLNFTVSVDSFPELTLVLADI